MFRKKKAPIDPAMLDDVIKSLQGSDELYTFSTKFESKQYGFSINFPDTPMEQEVEGGLGVSYHCTMPDTIFYGVMVLTADDTQDKNAIVNDIMDGVTDAPNWHEYSDRITIGVHKGHPALTQTFISDDNTMLINTTLFTEKYYYAIQVQNVYLEHAQTKLANFIDTFRLLGEHNPTTILNKSELLQQQHDDRREKYLTNMADVDLSQNVPVLGEVEYLQLHQTKMNIDYFNSRFYKYLDYFLAFDDITGIDDKVVLNSITSILDKHSYHDLASFEGRTGTAIKSAFLCALVSSNKNNIRAAYMQGKNSSHDKRFVAEHTDQEYIDLMLDEYSVVAAVISQVEPKRQKSIISTTGYILFG